MVKCQYLNCKENAKVFNKEGAYCLKHAKELGLVEQTNLLDFGFLDIKNRFKLGENKNE